MDLVIDCQFGLTNRLRALSSAYCFAKRTDRTLKIVWHPDHHCDCLFEDIFDVEGFHVSADCPDVSVHHIINCMEVEGYQALPLIHDVPNMHMYIKTYNPLNTLLDCEQVELDFLNRLNPSVEVAQLIRNIDTKDCIGVHIRRQNKQQGHSWEQVEGNWTEDGQMELDFARQLANPAFFVSEMENVLNQNPETRFFLATDDSGALNLIRNKFPDNCMVLVRDHFGRSKKDIQYALADLLLLSKCQYVLGSYFSSFSEMSSRIGKKKIYYSGFDFGEFSKPNDQADCVYMTDIEVANMLIQRLRQQRNVYASVSHISQTDLYAERGLGTPLIKLHKKLIKAYIKVTKRLGYRNSDRVFKSLGNKMIKLGRSLIRVDE